MNYRIRCLLSIAIALCSFSWTSFAQSASTATITGRVVDPQGAVLPGASIVAKNVDTGLQRGATTSAQGDYTIPNLPPGRYDVAASVKNFNNSNVNGVVIQVGDHRDVNFRLSVAGSQEIVEVSGQAPLVESTKTDLSTVVTDQEVSRLPTSSAFNIAGTSGVNGTMNDYAGLALTAPGVRFDTSGDSGDLIGPGSYNNRGNLYNVDGGNIADQVVSTRDTQGASVDEVKEFQVITNNYNAEYGQAGGVILNVVTKSGTNSIHGDFHFFARGRNLEASNFFYNQGLFNTPEVCPASNVQGGVLTKLDGCPRAHYFKHETGFTLGGPIVKDKTFWFVSYEKLLAGSPQTLTPPTGAFTVTQPDDEVMWSAKVDHQLSTRNHLALRFNVQRITEDNQLVQIPNTASPDALVGTIVHDHTLNGSLVSTLSPNTVNEARVFWHRFLNSIPDKSTLPGLQGPGFYEHAAFCCPQGADQNRYQGIDNLTWTHGAHTVKAGVSMTYFPYFSLFQQFHFGVWNFGHAFPPTGPGGLNPPTTFRVGIGPAAVNAKDNIYGWYVQDSWKLRPNLTVNYGLRWDYEAGAFKGGTIPTAGGGCLQANGIIPACSSDKNNFQPRVALAYSPSFGSGIGHWLFGDGNKSLITAAFGEITQLAYLNIQLDSLNFDGVNLLTPTIQLSDTSDPRIQAILAQFPNQPSQASLAPFLPVGEFGRVRPTSPHLHNPETREVSLTVQRELSNSTVLQLEYVGAFGFGQFGERDLNFPPVLEDPAHPGFFFLGPTPNPAFGPIREQENTRTSSYNGGIISLNRRFAKHVQFNTSYTFSKTLSSTEDFFGPSEPGDPRCISCERALAYNDARHAANFGFVFDTEKLLGGSSFLSKLTNDWQFGIVGNLHSGNPYDVSTGDVADGASFFPGLGAESQQRPNVLANGVLSASNIGNGSSGTNMLISPLGVATCLAASNNNASLCPAATTFVAPAGANSAGPVDTLCAAAGADCASVPVDFQFVNGNLQRNSGKGDPYYRFDTSITRSFPIPLREGMRVELRADFFNVFNHTNFLLFNGNDALNALAVPAPGSPNFLNCTNCIDPFTGMYRGANGQPLTIRDLQKGRINPKSIVNTGAGRFASIGDPTFADIARQIQLSLHVRF